MAYLTGLICDRCGSSNVAASDNHCQAACGDCGYMGETYLFTPEWVNKSPIERVAEWQKWRAKQARQVQMFESGEDLPLFSGTPGRK